MEMSAVTCATALFWLSLAVLGYTFIGYAWLMRMLARNRPPVEPGPIADWPHVTCVVVAFNEGERITARVQNLLDSDYAQDRLNAIIVSDGSTDATAERVRALDNPRVTLIEQPARAGKAAGLNAALAQCRSEIVVFADARQRFDKRTIRNLVRHFSDPAVGAVSGSLEIESAESGVGQAVDIYWRIEKRLRADEARFDSCIGCTGAVYAIRRELFAPLPENTLLDDVAIPMQVAVQGRRVLHEADAVAFDPQSLEPDREQQRKRRTLAGNFQMLLRYPQWLLPAKNRLWWQLVSHKYLRLAAPPFLVLAFVSNAILLTHPFYQVLFILQVVFYALALVGMFTSIRARVLAIPAGFVFLNTMIVRALWHYLTTAEIHHWRAVEAKRN
jgi:cellulose synthase/poly-beta-1,6-N-acetylglucosamine synthase-like glycosyltransferase